MLGRLVLPIEFRTEEGVVLVKEVEELKKFYRAEYTHFLVNALKSGRLEQFFFGNGWDEVRDLIVQMKEAGADEIDILNAVAEKLGVEKLPKDTKTYATFTGSLKDMLENGVEFFNLLSGDYSLVEGISGLSGRLRLIGGGQKLTYLRIDNLECVGGKELQIAFESLTFKPSGTEGRLVFENCKVIFEDVALSGVNIILRNADVSFINCRLEDVSVEANQCILSMQGISGAGLRGIKVTGSNFRLVDVDLKGNGSGSGIVTDNSRGYVEGSKVHGFEKGIACLNGSQVEISGCSVFENTAGGIGIQSSKFAIRQCEVYSNGVNAEEGFQIFIESSEGEIVGCKVYKSENAIGIKIVKGSKVSIVDSSCYENRSGIRSEENSEVKISKCNVFKNAHNGISIKSSKFTIEQCEIHSNNAKNEGHYPQVYVESSQGVISGCKVYKSESATGIYITKNSKVSVVDSSCHENSVGIVCLENSEMKILKCMVFKNAYNGINIKSSKFTIEQCEIHSNNAKKEGSYPQVWIENSQGEIISCKVYKAEDATGIYITKNSKVSVVDSSCYENGYGIWSDENSETKILRCTIYENARSGIVIESSKFTIEQCEIYSNNAKKEGDYPQVWIESSQGKIYGCNIHHSNGSNGINITENSEVSVMNSDIYKIHTGISCDKSSKLRLRGVKVREKSFWGWGVEVKKENLLECENCDIEGGITEPCFITSAVMNYLGKGDRCYELETFRKYRDAYLMATEEGRRLVEEYYRIAPQIVMAIESREDRDDIYGWLWREYLSGCLRLIEDGKYEEAKVLYVRMVEELKRRLAEGRRHADS